MQMPVAKIHVLEGQYDKARLGKVSTAVQNGLMSALGIPPDDFFQIIHILPRSQFLHTLSFLGLKYSDDLFLLEVTFISGRPKEQRLGLLTALNDGVVAAAGISTKSGALKEYPYGFSSRCEGKPGTNPEELIGAAHAGCFTMALSLILGEAKLTAEHMDTTAEVTLEKVVDGFAITAVHLTLR